MLFARLNLLLLTIGSLAPVAQAQEIKLMIQEFAPFNHTDPKTRKIVGFITDKAQAIIQRAGGSSSISSTSLARALQAARTEENTCVLSLRRTPERENSYQWVGPLIITDWALYGKKGNPNKLKNFEDAKAYRIGSYKASATAAELRALGYTIELAGQDEENPRLMMNQRIDYWIVAEQRGMYITRQQGYENEIGRIASYKTIELFMLCHSGMPKQQIDLFNRINKELDSDGTMNKILQKYGVN